MEMFHAVIAGVRVAIVMPGVGLPRIDKAQSVRRSEGPLKGHPAFLVARHVPIKQWQMLSVGNQE